MTAATYACTYTANAYSGCSTAQLQNWKNAKITQIIETCASTLKLAAALPHKSLLKSEKNTWRKKSASQKGRQAGTRPGRETKKYKHLEVVLHFFFFFLSSTDWPRPCPCRAGIKTNFPMPQIAKLPSYRMKCEHGAIDWKLQQTSGAAGDELWEIRIKLLKDDRNWLQKYWELRKIN